MEGVLRTATPALVATVGLVSAAFVAATLLLRALLPDQEIAGGLASLMFAGGPHVHRALAARLGQTTTRAPISSPVGFTLPWWLMAIAAMAILTAAMLAADVGTLALGPIASVSPAISTLLAIAAPAAAFGIGSWIGARAERASLGTLAIVIAVVGAFVLARAFAVPAIEFLTGSTPPPGLFDTSPCTDSGATPAAGSLTGLIAAAPPGSPPLPPPPPGVSPPVDSSPGSLASPTAPTESGTPDDGPPPFTPNYLYGTCALQALLDNTLLLVGAFGLIGAWRGGATREARYLARLLGAVPPATRAAIVELAYEEATRSRASAAADDGAGDRSQGP